LTVTVGQPFVRSCYAYQRRVQRLVGQSATVRGMTEKKEPAIVGFDHHILFLVNRSSPRPPPSREAIPPFAGTLGHQRSFQADPFHISRDRAKDIFRIAVEAVDEAGFVSRVVCVRVIVGWARANAFELDDADSDFSKTLIVPELDVGFNHRSLLSFAHRSS
jgi:hypothetical protein